MPPELSGARWSALPEKDLRHCNSSLPNKEQDRDRQVVVFARYATGRPVLGKSLASAALLGSARRSLKPFGKARPPALMRPSELEAHFAGPGQAGPLLDLAGIVQTPADGRGGDI